MMRCWLILILSLVLSGNVWAKSPSKELPILIRADHMVYDRINQTVQADGNIRVEQKISTKEKRILHCDRLLYQVNNKKIFASGHVVMFSPNGDMSQGDKLEITDDFANGIMCAMRLLMADQTRMTAKYSKRNEGKENLYYTAQYSPCSLCRITKKEPTWQLYASEVKHDQENLRVEYYNMRLAIKGIPLFYLPYFSHPDPKVKRKSGFLFPKYGQSKDFGSIISTPYFWDIAPNRDLTITPIITTKQGPIIAGDYRHRFYDGSLNISSSYTDTRSLKGQKKIAGDIANPKSTRWHLKSLMKNHISEYHRFMLDINRASDTTYLIRYPLNQQTISSSFIENKTLTSRGIFESIYPNTYFGTKFYMFQNDVPRTTPFIHPMMNLRHQGNPDRFGGTTTFESQLLTLSREESLPGRYGTSMERFSTGATWRMPYTTRSGQVITTSLGTRFDGYHLKNFSPLGNAKNRNNMGRVYPFASVQWRYPFVQYTEGTSWLIQPIGMIVSSPKTFNYKNIPVEDSNSTEIDDRSIFLPNRFDGIDRVDSGHRFIGGLEQDWKFTESRNINLFLGQTYRLDNTRVISDGLGEDNRKSDYIGRLLLRPHALFASRIRSAIYPKTLRARYTEVGFILGKPIFEADVGYAFLSKKASSKNQMLSQAFAKVSSKFHDNWSVAMAQIRDMKKHPNSANVLGTFGSLVYQDDCFIVDLGIFNKKYRDRDIKPDKGFLLQFTFKNLGTFTPLSTTRYPGSMLTQIR